MMRGKKTIKRFVSAALAVLISAQAVICSYAATPSDADYSYLIDDSFGLDLGDGAAAPSVFDIINEHVNSAYANEEPFYFDEDGNKIYDSEIEFPDFYYMNKLGIPDYSDIEWTFEEYPETMMSYDDGTSTMSAIAVGSIAVVIIAVACAVCGYAISKDDVPAFVSKGFEPWLRRNKMADQIAMTTWQACLSVGFSSAFTGMKKLVSLIKEYFDSITVSNTEISFPTNVSSTTPYFKHYYENNSDYEFILSGSYDFIDQFSGFMTKCSDYVFNKPDLANVYMAYYSNCYPSSVSEHEQYIYFNWANSSGSETAPAIRQLYSNYISDGYFSSSPTTVTSHYTVQCPISILAYLDFPVFINGAAMMSWFNYGTVGGMVNASEFISSDAHIPVQNEYADLKTDFLIKFNAGTTFTVPDTQEAYDALFDAITQAKTSSDLLSSMASAWEVTKTDTGGTVSMPNYTDYAFVLSAFLTYFGVQAPPVELPGDFLDDLKNKGAIDIPDGLLGQVDDLLKEGEAQEVMKTHIFKTGNNQNNNNNKFRGSKNFAKLLLAFLVSQQLVSSSNDFDFDTLNEVKIDDNITVSDVASEDENPIENPSTGGTVNLSGITSILQNIYSFLQTMPEKFASAVKSFFDSIVTAINNIGSKISTAQESFFSSTNVFLGNIVDALKSLPANIANAQKVFFDSIVNAIDAAVKTINSYIPDYTDFFVNLPGRFVTAFTNSFNSVIDAFNSAIKTINSYIPDYSGSLADMPGRIASFFSDYFSSVIAAINNGFNKVIDAINGDPLPDPDPSDPSNPGSEDPTPVDPEGPPSKAGLFSVIYLLVLIFLIFVAALSFCIMVLKFIFALRNIPVSTVLMSEHMEQGVTWFKSIGFEKGQLLNEFTGININDWNNSSWLMVKRSLNLWDLIMAALSFVILIYFIRIVFGYIKKLHFDN